MFVDDYGDMDRYEYWLRLKNMQKIAKLMDPDGYVWWQGEGATTSKIRAGIRGVGVVTLGCALNRGDAVRQAERALIALARQSVTKENYDGFMEALRTLEALSKP